MRFTHPWPSKGPQKQGSSVFHTGSPKELPAFSSLAKWPGLGSGGAVEFDLQETAVWAHLAMRETQILSGVCLGQLLIYHSARVGDAQW